MPTILITGCSSGFGLETARHFLAEGWNVIATMRTPKADLLPVSDRLTILPLDVTDPQSIAAAVAAAPHSSCRSLARAAQRCEKVSCLLR